MGRNRTERSGFVPSVVGPDATLAAATLSRASNRRRRGCPTRRQAVHPLADLAAFVLDCGPGAVASGISAAALHEFDGCELAPPAPVTIPRGRAIDRAGHHVHTSARLDPIDCTRVHGIPTMTPARDIIDLSRVLT